MKPKLLIGKDVFIPTSRRVVNRKPVVTFHFAIINADSPKPYPLNFLCNLPKTKDCFIYQRANIPKFVRLFGNNRLDLAIDLLNNALVDPQYSSNPEVVQEIKQRINIISHKPEVEAVIKSAQSPSSAKLCQSP